MNLILSATVPSGTLGVSGPSHSLALKFHLRSQSRSRSWDPGPDLGLASGTDSLCRLALGTDSVYLALDLAQSLALLGLHSPLLNGLVCSFYFPSPYGASLETSGALGGSLAFSRSTLVAPKTPS